MSSYYADYILNEIPNVSQYLREKIDLIENSHRMSYKDFNEYKFLMENLNKFSPHPHLKESQLREQINYMIDRVKTTLERLCQNLENNNLLLNPQDTTNPNCAFYLTLAKISRLLELTDENQFTYNQIRSLRQDIEHTMKLEISEEQREILSLHAKELDNILETETETNQTTRRIQKR